MKKIIYEIYDISCEMHSSKRFLSSVGFYYKINLLNFLLKESISVFNKFKLIKY